MLQVKLSSAFSAATGGAESIGLRAETINQLFTELLKHYPQMRQHLDEGIAVAIDGEIYRDNWGIQITPKSEVFLMPRIAGG